MGVKKEKKIEIFYCGIVLDVFFSFVVFYIFFICVFKIVRFVYRGEIIIKNMLIE